MSTPARVSPAQTRKLIRAFHLLVAVAVGVLAYVPALSPETVRDLLAWVAVPLLAVSGVAMWQQARLRRLMRGRSTR